MFNTGEYSYSFLQLFSSHALFVFSVIYLLVLAWQNIINLKLKLKYEVFSIGNFQSWTLQRMSRMTKHVSKAGKVDPGDRVTLPVKFACKPELTLSHLLGYPSTRVTLSLSL